MKRILPILLFLVSAASLQAQVVNLTDVLSGRHSKVVVTVRDSLSREPLGFASVYLVPDKDTVITNFALTDTTGRATLEEVPFGAYSFPLGNKQIWSMSAGVGGEYTRSSGYYSSAEGKGMDINSFQYASFMKDFWGNADGDRFYSGESGFRENTTRWMDLYGRALVKYNARQFSVRLMYTYTLQKAWYTLFPEVRRNTHDHSVALGADYTTRHEFELSSQLTYTRYYGYTAGFGLPEWIWDMEISKNIGPFNLSIQAHDLLDQTRNLSRIAQGNFEETSYRLVMGRYILFGIRWNFGKMNSTHSMRAEMAAIEMSM